MLPAGLLSMRFLLVSFAGTLLALVACAQPPRAQSAYVCFSQVGYESGETPFRAYLVSTAVSGKRSRPVREIQRKQWRV
jgi:hypothetical protein